MLRKWTLGSLLVVAVLLPRTAVGQADVLLGGDGTTTEVLGKRVCGTDPLFLNAIDTDRFETYSASEFAATVLELRGAIPSPLGKDSPKQQAPFLLAFLP